MTLKTGNSPWSFLFLFSLFCSFSLIFLFLKSPPFSVLLWGAHPFGFLFFSLFLYFPKVPLLAFCPGVLTLSVPSCPGLGARCWRRNETPTQQSGLNLCILTLASYSCFILYPLHNNLQGKLPSTMIQRLYSAQAQGEITFTLAYLLQLRLCFGELPYQLRIHSVPGSVPFEESEKHPCVQEMFFSHGNKQRILS